MRNIKRFRPNKCLIAYTFGVWALAVGSKVFTSPAPLVAQDKGLRKNNFTELVPRFRSDLFDPKLQSHSHSRPMSRNLRLRTGQRWPEDGMRKCEVIFA